MIFKMCGNRGGTHFHLLRIISRSFIRHNTNELFQFSTGLKI